MKSTKTTSSSKSTSKDFAILDRLPKSLQNIESKMSSFIENEFGEEAADYAQKTMKWLKKNPGISTMVAVLGAVAAGAVIKKALSSPSNTTHH